jgi:hypothetical protein
MLQRKYIANSAHDVTIAALFATLGLEPNLDRPGTPHYAATVLVELWRRKTTDGGVPSPDDFYLRVSDSFFFYLF